MYFIAWPGFPPLQPKLPYVPPEQSISCCSDRDVTTLLLALACAASTAPKSKGEMKSRKRNERGERRRKEEGGRRKEEGGKGYR